MFTGVTQADKMLIHGGKALESLLPRVLVNDQGLDLSREERALKNRQEQ